MADQQISVVFTADASPMTAELRAAVNELRKLELALKKTTDINEINQLTVQIGLLKDKISSLGGVVQNAGSKLGSNLKSVANNAAFAVNDLNRVVQDLPYGFIGISNNINPLLESFTRLKASAKESGTTLGSELLGALTGPSGLALAVAAVTSAITFAQIGLSRWMSSSKDASSETGHLKSVLSELAIETKRTKEEFDDYAKSLDKIKEIGELDIRLNITGAGDLADFKRSIASVQLQADLLTEKIGGGTFVFGPGVGKGALAILNEEEDKLARLGNIVNSFAPKTKTISLWGDANDAVIEYRNNLAAIGGLENAYLATDEQLASFNNQQKAAIKAYGEQQKVVKNAKNQLQDYQQQLRYANKQVKVLTQIEKDRIEEQEKNKKKEETLQDVIDKLKKDLEDRKELSKIYDKSTLDEQVNLITTAIDKVVTKFKQTKEDKSVIDFKFTLDETQTALFKEKTSTLLEDLRKNISKEELQPNFGVSNINNEIKLIASALKSLDKLSEEFKKPIDSNIISDLNSQLDILNKKLKETKLKEYLSDLGISINLSSLDEQISIIQSAIKKLRTDFKLEESDPIVVQLQIQLEALIKQKKFVDIIKQIEEQIKSIIEDFTVSIAEGLGQVLSGNAANFLDGFISMLSSGLITIGKLLLKIGGLAELVQVNLQKIFSGPQGPYYAIAAGIAAIALGTALKNFQTKKAFAVGTNYAPGGMALVGERGPEMVSLPRGARVTPAAQTAQMLGGAMQQVEVFGVLRGQDIYFSNKKYSQTYRRTT